MMNHLAFKLVTSCTMIWNTLPLIVVYWLICYVNANFFCVFKLLCYKRYGSGSRLLQNKNGMRLYCACYAHWFIFWQHTLKYYLFLEHRNDVCCAHALLIFFKIKVLNIKTTQRQSHCVPAHESYLEKA